MSVTETQTTFPNPNEYAPVPESAEVQEFAAHQGPVEDTIPGRDANLDALVNRFNDRMDTKARDKIAGAVQNGVREAIASVEPTEEEEAWNERTGRTARKLGTVSVGGSIAQSTRPKIVAPPARARAHQLARR